MLADELDYVIGVEYRLHGLENTISGYHYTASLDNPIPFLEKRIADEATNAKVYAGVAGEIEELTVSKAGTTTRKPVNGDITYAGMRNQYFAQALIPVSKKAIGAELAQCDPEGNSSGRHAAVRIVGRRCRFPGCLVEVAQCPGGRCHSVRRPCRWKGVFLWRSSGYA